MFTKRDQLMMSEQVRSEASAAADSSGEQVTRKTE
jgi:hypothetical protein